MNPQGQLDDNMTLPEPLSGDDGLRSTSSEVPDNKNTISNIKTEDDKSKSVVTNLSKDNASMIINKKDTDLIEKEWINKVKKIIDSNRGNPYQQSRQINQLKAEYMLDKYNKVIKLAEE